MIPKDAINPFRPGPGQIPPVFPGRAKEQCELRSFISALERYVIPAKDMIVCAPRGNGKTALLAWFEQEVISYAPDKIDLIDMTPDDIPTTQALADRISLLENKTGLLERIGGSMEVKVPALLTGVSADAGIQARLNPAPYQQATHTVTRTLLHRCRKKPTVLLLDEAHNLQQPVGQALLNASQRAKKKAPFLLIMAGTPGLRNHLNTVDATFWERNEILQPGLLSPDDARKAITVPLNAYRITFDGDILETIMDDSQGYPYFTQLWGEKLFNHLQAQQTGHVDHAILRLALADIEERRQIFYRGRYDRLDERALVPAAARIAEHFARRPVLGEDKIKQLLDKVGLPAGQTPESVKKELVNEGYIWLANPSGQFDFYPGIPSLMTYIRTCAQSLSL